MHFQNDIWPHEWLDESLQEWRPSNYVRQQLAQPETSKSDTDHRGHPSPFYFPLKVNEVIAIRIFFFIQDTFLFELFQLLTL